MLESVEELSGRCHPRARPSCFVLADKVFEPEWPHGRLLIINRAIPFLQRKHTVRFEFLAFLARRAQNTLTGALLSLEPKSAIEVLQHVFFGD